MLTVPSTPVCKSSRTSRPRRRIAVALALALGLTAARAADYYVDPINGSMANNGSAAAPWSTLSAVFANIPYKVFAAGDVIYLRSGYHGIVSIKAPHGTGATIRPDNGATPLIRKLSATGVSGWTFDKLDICPEYLAAGSYDPGTLLNVTSSCSTITITNCRIRHALDTTGWTVPDWQARADGTAINVDAPNSVVSNNTLENIGFGIAIGKTSTNTRVSGNTIIDFFNDGLRGLGDYGIFEDNLVQNPIGGDGNHDDFFQSWSIGINPVTGLSQAGYGVVKGVIVRNNMFLEDPDPASSPLAVEAQGAGLFDGMFEDFVIENNLIVSSAVAHGISIYGGVNCRVTNNTIAVGKLGVAADKPRVNFYPHKDYDHDGNAATAKIPWPVLATGNIARNNIVAAPVTIMPGTGSEDHNLASKDYAALFTDYANYDFTTKAYSPAIDAGTSTGAPSVDIDGMTRSLPYDIGAYEFFPGAAVYEGFGYAPTTNVSSAPDSSDDVGFTGTTWTGGNDIVAPGLVSGAMPQLGNALTMSANVGSVRNIDMVAFPAGYTQVDGDSVTRLGKPGTTLWVRFLIRADGADAAGTLTAGINLNGAATGGVTKLRLGDVGTNINWSCLKGTTVGASTSPIVVGETVNLVARIKFVAGTNNDEVDLFVNPALQPAAPTTPSATLRNLDIGTFDRIEIKGNRTTTVDEFAIATEWNNL